VTDKPVIYCGRVTRPEHAARIVAAGEADLVGVVRATIADPEFVSKARTGAAPIRPCIGLNDCIHRKLVEGLEYACGANADFGREGTGRPARTRHPRRILVLGGGPGGTEAAALCAEQGHDVTLWERDTALGGALARAARLRGNRRYADWIAWQAGRLERAGVTVHLGRDATADTVLAEGADLVVVATGAAPRVPSIPGVDGPHVATAIDVLEGRFSPGRRVALVVEDDGPAPPTVADHLAGLGHEVTMVFPTPGPSPLVGKYSLGSMLRRLDEGGVVLVAQTAVVGIEGTELAVANSFSGRHGRLGPFDSVVLACGGVPRDELYHQLRSRHPDVRLLGDAYAPRRMVFATRQAWALMEALADAV
jgi:NADPH-dependent 2,4-dienoyl-CoA reductase/sulfur reductase-like enzyme